MTSSVASRVTHGIAKLAQSAPHLRVQLAAFGVATLPDFVDAAARESVLRSSATQRHAHHHSGVSTVFLTPLSGGDGGPHEFESVYRLAAVPGDVLHPKGFLHRVYLHESFLEALREVFDTPDVHPYADPMSCVSLSIMSAGDQLDWHFDDSAFGVTLVLATSEHGGCFEVCPTPLAKDDNSGINRFLSASSSSNQPRSLDVGAGTLILFRGSEHLHRVTRVTGRVPRVVALFSYGSEPGQSDRPEVRRVRFGRSTPLRPL